MRRKRSGSKPAAPPRGDAEPAAGLNGEVAEQSRQQVLAASLLNPNRARACQAGMVAPCAVGQQGERGTGGREA